VIILTVAVVLMLNVVLSDRVGGIDESNGPCETDWQFS
jgi:hypothetical protein